MKSFIVQIVVRLFGLYDDILQWAMDFWQVKICKKHKKILKNIVIAPLNFDNSKKIAVFVVFPLGKEKPPQFTLNALESLHSLGFYTVVVSPAPLNANWRSAIDPLVGRLIERVNIGRDFACYREGLNQLGLWDAGLPTQCETLIIANDSLFYPNTFTNTLEVFLKKNAPWGSLYRSLQLTEHAQSFFTIYDPSVFQNTLFKDFWRDYKCYSSRTYCILSGEIALSNTVKKLATGITTLYSTSWLNQILLEKLSSISAVAEIMKLIPTGPAEVQPTAFSPPSVRQFIIDSVLALHSSSAENLLLQEIRMRVVAMCEIHNPTHIAGLIFQHYTGAPLKRDVCYRGSFSIEQIMENLVGFDDEALQEIRRDLERRALPQSRGFWQRMRHASGRI